MTLIKCNSTLDVVNHAKRLMGDKIINNGILCMANIDFACPKCKKIYSDIDDKYLNRCNKNQNGCAKIKCDCGQPFYMTYNYKGDAVSFLP